MKNSMKKLTINLVYFDDFGSWRFELLTNNKGCISPEFLDENEFLNCQGGIELIFDSYLIFFQSYDYLDLVTCVDFLIDSLNVGKNTKLINTNGSTLFLIENDEETLSLSYKNEVFEKSRYRNCFYFENVIINKKMWLDATFLALKEYFDIAERIVNKFPNDESNNILKNKISVWKHIYSNSN